MEPRERQRARVLAGTEGLELHFEGALVVGFDAGGVGLDARQNIVNKELRGFHFVFVEGHIGGIGGDGGEAGE